jgi:hypothetical protein
VKNVPRDPGITTLTAGASTASAIPKDLLLTSAIWSQESVTVWQASRVNGAIGAVLGSITFHTAGPAIVMLQELGKIRLVALAKNNYFCTSKLKSFMVKKLSLNIATFWYFRGLKVTCQSCLIH